MLTILSAPLLAQTVGSESDGVLFAPKKGQWQVSVLLGGGNNFYNENTSYLLPQNTHTGGEVGLPNGGGANSGDLNRYLNIDGLNNNSLTNILGVEGKYFISDCWDINFQFAMNINLTPKKDYVEGDGSVPDMVIPAQKYINAQATNNWYVSVGSNRYFKVNNPRIHPYLGSSLGFQMARIETTEPYTGETTTGSSCPALWQWQPCRSDVRHQGCRCSRYRIQPGPGPGAGIPVPTPGLPLRCHPAVPQRF